MDIFATRFGSIPGQGTFGEWVIGHFTIKTIEREWLNNQRNVSCIPAGTYDLVPHTRPNGDEVYAIVNEDFGVYLYPNDKAERDLILVHVANIIDDIEGCIGPGSAYGGSKKGMFGVHNSSVAMVNLRGLLGRTETHKLHIKWKEYP